MKWTKLGQIYQHQSSNALLLSHASNPLALQLYDDVFRIFYSSRDINNKSSIGYVDFDVEKLKVTNLCTEPLFVYGDAESFYSHGVSIGNMYSQETKNYILFMGWNIKNNEHWKGDIGRLELENNTTLTLVDDKPYLGLDSEDSISLSYPWVIKENDIYKMWYGSTVDWTSENGEMIHVIKYATSNNGENWIKHGIAIPYEIGIAQAFSRPTVLVINNEYHMWYSYRSGDGTKYRIGYSFSKDGITWQRKHDEVGIEVSISGWDSEMICYPFVFQHKGNAYMLYNGNDYGKTGFGLAILEK